MRLLPRFDNLHKDTFNLLASPFDLTTILGATPPYCSCAGQVWVPGTPQLSGTETVADLAGQVYVVGYSVGEVSAGCMVDCDEE